MLLWPILIAMFVAWLIGILFDAGPWIHVLLAVSLVGAIIERIVTGRPFSLFG